MTVFPEYEQVGTATYNDICRQLVFSKKKDKKQAKLLRMLRNLDRLAEYLTPHNPVSGSTPVPLLDDRVSVSTFRSFHPEEAARITAPYAKLGPGQASRTGFWAHATMQNILAKRMSILDLAGLNSYDVDGLNKNQRDKAVRLLLRRLGGLFPVRGYNSVPQDCLLARTWWRERWLSEIKFHHALRENEMSVVRQTLPQSVIWSPITELVMKRNAIAGHPLCRSSIIIGICEWRHRQSKSPKSTETSRALRLVARAMSGYECAVLPATKVRNIVASALQPYRI